MSILSFFDAYTIRARLFPAVIAAAPALALAAASVTWSNLNLSTAFVTLALLVMLFVFADVARRNGREVEASMEARLGGRPSVIMLRHRSHKLHPETRERYVGFLASKLNEKAPSRAEEESNPTAADAFYERCGVWLREHTRDIKKFHILFSENMTYGFRRNLLGLKKIALFLNILVFLICVGLAVYYWPVIPGSEPFGRLLPVLLIAVAHAAFVILYVNEQGVQDASEQYARQLILSCESLMSASAAKPPIRRTRTKKSE
jgi:hypothetical protein